jgi:hypothetical protein
LEGFVEGGDCVGEGGEGLDCYAGEGSTVEGDLFSVMRWGWDGMEEMWDRGLTRLRIDWAR